MHAQRSDKGWTIEEIEGVYLGGYYGMPYLPKFSSLDIDTSDVPHVSFVNNELDKQYFWDLQHAYKETGSWQLEIVDYVYGYGYYDLSSSLKTFTMVEPETHITYSASFREGLKYATNASGEWRTYAFYEEREDGDLPFFPQIFMDADGYIYILYMYGSPFGGYSEHYLLTNRPAPVK